MKMLGLVTLWLGGLGYVAFGLAFMLRPLETIGAAGIEVTGAVAATELRAFYGGLELALGALLLAGALRPGRRRDALVLCLASYGGIGTARLLGIVLAGGASPFLWFALGTELLLATMAALALRG
jgi:hypothetical protein